ncbi:hypothetical protein DOTSEDRAFT_79419 [Dothistroma septosporum NZE10]|uniref:Heterokaryon incompatibility domain-containing protein n=1 Tax=Dothistroma septosporum (strain NZE10 / CBS 128990) TaxID=675120 RepID=N1PSS8_DOTSN|nr:hypothetical protein DOTSEDRAFT_79419 [Dothistroma septosporum NZE10]
MDTVCIDEHSSAELSFRMNYTFARYASPEECYASLADISVSVVNGDQDKLMKALVDSEWFDRSWTLQELLASKQVIFLYRTWKTFGRKRKPGSAEFQAHHDRAHLHAEDIRWEVNGETGIPPETLRDCGLIRTYFVAQRISRAASRRSIRAEDNAHYMLGLRRQYVISWRRQMCVYQTTAECRPRPTRTLATVDCAKHGLHLPMPSGGMVDFWKISRANCLTKNGEALMFLLISLNCEDVDLEGRRTPCAICLSRMRVAILEKSGPTNWTTTRREHHHGKKDSVTIDSTSRSSVSAHSIDCEDLPTMHSPWPHQIERGVDGPSNDASYRVSFPSPNVQVLSRPSEHSPGKIAATSRRIGSPSYYAVEEHGRMRAYAIRWIWFSSTDQLHLILFASFSGKRYCKVRVILCASLAGSTVVPLADIDETPHIIIVFDPHPSQTTIMGTTMAHGRQIPHFVTLPPEIREEIYRLILNPAANRVHHEDEYTSYNYTRSLVLFRISRQIYLEARKIFRDLNIFVRVDTPWPEAQNHVAIEGHVPIIVTGKRAVDFKEHSLNVAIDAPSHGSVDWETQCFIILVDDLEKFCLMWYYADLTHPGLNEHLRLKLQLRDPYAAEWEERRTSRALQQKLLSPFGKVKGLYGTVFENVNKEVKPFSKVEKEMREEQDMPHASPEHCLREATRFKFEGNAELKEGRYEAALEKYRDAWTAMHVVVKGRQRFIHADSFFGREMREEPYKEKNGQSERLLLRVQLVANTCQVYLKQEEWELCRHWGMRSISMLREAMGVDDTMSLSPEAEAVTTFPAAAEMGKIYYRTAVAWKVLGDKSEARKLLRVAKIYLPNDKNVDREIAATALRLG